MTDNDSQAPVRLEWHPAIRILIGAVFWLYFAAAAIVWEFFVSGWLDPAQTVARTVWMLALFILLLPVLFLLDLLGGAAQWVWDVYPGAESRSLRRLAYSS